MTTRKTNGTVKASRQTEWFVLLLRIAAGIALALGIWFAIHYSFIFTARPTPIRTFTFIFVEAVLLAAVILGGVFPRFVYNKRKEMLLFLIMSVFCLVALEIGLRVLNVQQPLYSHHPYLNYYGTPNYVSADGLNEHNSLGFRGGEITQPKPTGTYRIVLLGGSTTYTIAVKDWQKDWARQLQGDLRTKFDSANIEVINAGLGGWDSWEDFVNLQFRVLDLDPDLIILYEGTNDVHTRLVPPSAYRSDNTGRRKQWQNEPFSIFSLRIVQILTQTDNRFSVDAPTYGATDDPGYSHILGMTPLEALKQNPPIYFERNMRSMIAIAHEYNITPLLSTWAYSDQLSDYAATEHYQFGFAQNNDAVKSVAARTGTLLYDYAHDMPMDKQYWADGRHVNELGAALQGKLFAEYIYNESSLHQRIRERINGKSEK